MKSDVLTFDIKDRLCTITLNRPEKLNAFDAVLRRDLLAAIVNAEANPAVRVIVLKGSGKGFCAGADLGEGLKNSVEQQLREEYKPIFMCIHDCPKPVIAQVHGSAAGIGAALALVCDMVVMSHDAYLYLAFAAIGLIPDGGMTWHLYHILGPRRAFEIISGGKKLMADECFSYGICNAVVAIEKLDDTVLECAGTLAAGAPLAQAAAKRVLRQMEMKTLPEAIDLEAKMQQSLSESNDCQNAIAAFFRKQKPVFTGQ